jgi:putative mRNA 3-end processing factor
MDVRKSSFSTHEVGERVKLDDIEVSIHNAGHMLGSAQFSVHTPTQAIVYTGDINCRDMFTTNAAEKVECDVLVLETTYGNPFYVFPDLAQTSAEMVEWTVREIKRGRTPVFRVYSSGKPQEIIRIFNIFTNIPVVTDSRIAATTSVYVKNHIPLCFLSSETKEGKEALASGEAVFITSSEVLDETRNASVATATGWALSGRQNSRSPAFPLSSHADFRQLVQYVEAAKPREVLTLHGFKEEFASYIRRKLNVRAKPLPPIEQRILQEYL